MTAEHLPMTEMARRAGVDRLMNHKSFSFRVFNRSMNEVSNLLFRGILGTPPMPSDPSSELLLYSLTCKRDVCAYLVAAKSFLRYTPAMNVVVQSDGSLDTGDCQVLRRHIPNICILSRESTDELLLRTLPRDLSHLIKDTNFFVGLKLLNPILRFQGRYVVHLDSDVVFVRRPVEIVDCLTGKPPRAFYCPGGNVLAEAFHRIGFDFSNADVKSFNSGLMGGGISFGLDAVSDVAGRIREHDAKLFSVWDVEQAMWAVLMNHCGPALNLGSFGRNYVGNGWAAYSTLLEQSALVHFVGATRFRNFMYPRLASRAIRELKRGGA